MRVTAVRRTAIAAAVASLAMLATACGGSDSGGTGDDGKTGAKEAAPSKPAVKALTAAELEKASLAQGDVKAHKISKTGPADMIEAVTVEKKECEPFAQAFFAVKRGTPVGTAGRKAISEPEKPKAEDGASAEDMLAGAFDVTSTMITLTSYDAGGAAKSLAEVRESATECAGGFDLTLADEKQKVVKLTEEKVTGGEEAIAWTVMTEADGEQTPFKLVVSRQAGTVASFVSYNLGAVGGGATDFELPTAVVDAQLAKLA